jgi:AraC-like DNA-binding protein
LTPVAGHTYLVEGPAGQPFEREWTTNTSTTGSVTHRSTSPVPTQWTFSTTGLPDDQRIARWEAHNTAALVGLRCRTVPGRVLEASESNVQVDRLHVARVRATAHSVERTAQVIEHSPADSVAAYLTLRGRAVFRDDRGLLLLEPGQLLICDTDRPFERTFSDGLEELAIKVPRAVLADLTGAPQHATVVADFGEGPVSSARTLARLLAKAVRGGAHPPAAHEQTLLELLAVIALGDRAGSPAVHRANAHGFIEDHLCDPGLTASQVAGATGISDRQLGRIFAADGTSVPRHVLHRRLDVAHALLSGPQAHELTVADVGARCGFASSTYFSHTFRERFGLRATEVRRRGVQQRSS